MSFPALTTQSRPGVEDFLQTTVLPSNHRRPAASGAKGFPIVGLSRPDWSELKAQESGTVERKITEDFLRGGPRARIITYEARFDRCDREEDYAKVWRESERRIKP
jgi:hypothetical protein